MYHGFNMYSGLLDEQVMENITGCQYDLAGDLVSWETAEWTVTNPDLVTKGTMDFSEICADKSKEHVFVIPTPILTQQMGLDRCKALGMTMVVPYSRFQHDKTVEGANSVAMRKQCFQQGRCIVSFAVRYNKEYFFDPQVIGSTDVEYVSKGDFSITRSQKALQAGRIQSMGVI